METKTISTENFSEIFYRKEGTGPAIVLLHGFPEDSSLWDPIVPALQQNFTVLRPDIPGAGQSKGVTENTTVEDLAEIIYAVMQEERLQEIILAGHSMGGYISLAFAEKHPSLLRGLSLIHSTAVADTQEKKEIRKKAIQLIRNGGKEAFIRQMIPNLFSEEHKKDEALMNRQTERGLKLSSESIIAFYSAMIKRPDRTANLGMMNIPVQWIAGQEDGIIPAESIISQAQMANTNFISLYKNSAHMSMIEQPQQLSADLEAFARYCFNR